MLTEAEALRIVDTALAAAEGDAATASLHGDETGSTRFADNVITQSVRQSNCVVSLSCSFGQRHGSASTNDLSSDALRRTAARAAEAARLAPPDPEYMPPTLPEETGAYPEVHAWCERTAATSPADRARPLAQCTGRLADEGYRLSGAFATGAHVSAFGNSNGVRAAFLSTHAQVHTTVLGADGTGWAQASGASADDVRPQDVLTRAFDIARKAQCPTPVDPGPYTVVLSPAAVAGLIPHTMVRDAKATDEGRTFLRGKLGQQICDSSITVRSDPSESGCLSCTYGAGGLAQKPALWIEDGVLRNLAVSRYWARRTGRPPLPYPSNIIINGGDASIDELVAGVQRGILVTRFWYIRNVDSMRSLVTGMTRDGLFLIEDGQVSRPLLNLRFNVSVLECLQRVDALGRRERVHGCLVPALRVRDFNFTSVTKF